MERRIRWILLVAIVFPGLRAKAQQPVDTAFASALQHKLDSCRTVFAVPGISATLLLPGDRYWNGTSGLAHIYDEVPLDTTYLFQMASVTKLFASALVFQLIEEGLLGLDDTVDEHLDPIPFVPGGTRIRYLLNHRSGIADHIPTNGVFATWMNDPDSIWPPALAISEFGGPPLFTQNAAFSYSNTNYVLLGMLIEAVTGTTVAQAFQERFWSSMGLENTFFAPEDELDGELVPGWGSFIAPNTYDTDVTPILNDCFASIGSTAGALYSTPWDVARFTRHVMTGSVVSPTSLTTMRICSNVSFSDGCNGYGFGTMRYTYAGRTYFGHSGDIYGFTQMAIHGLQDSVTLVLSINRNNAPRGPIAAAMLAAVHQQLSVGIGEQGSSSPVFSLFPVPATEVVTIRLAHTGEVDRIEVISTTGQVVHSERAREGREHQLSLRGIGAGVYQVRVSGRAGSWARTLVVE